MCSRVLNGLCPCCPVWSDEETEWRQQRNKENPQQAVTCNDCHYTLLDKDRERDSPVNDMSSSPVNHHFSTHPSTSSITLHNIFAAIKVPVTLSNNQCLLVDVKQSDQPCFLFFVTKENSICVMPPSSQYSHLHYSTSQQLAKVTLAH